MKLYAYRYSNEDDTPMLDCPECEASLTRPGGVRIEFVTDENIGFEQPARLDATGLLVDPSGCVAAGMHSQSCCGACGESLVYHETDASPAPGNS